MSTPRKNINTASPYASAPAYMPTYPSQSADYNSFYMGGQAATNNSGNWRQRNQSRGAFSAMQRNNNNNNNKNKSYFYSQNGNVDKSPAQNNQHNFGSVPYFYQDRTIYEPRYNNNNNKNNRQNNYHNKNFNYGGGGGSFHNRNNGNRRQHQRYYNLNSETADISDYIHPSMLEDPWHDLMKRHKAIEECDLKLHLPGNNYADVDAEMHAEIAKSNALENKEEEEAKGKETTGEVNKEYAESKEEEEEGKENEQEKKELNSESANKSVENKEEEEEAKGTEQEVNEDTASNALENKEEAKGKEQEVNEETASNALENKEEEAKCKERVSAESANNSLENIEEGKQQAVEEVNEESTSTEK